MNILLNIVIYMLASSLIMVGYVWIKSIRHHQSEFRQMSDISGATSESQPKKESIAA